MRLVCLTALVALACGQAEPTVDELIARCEDHPSPGCDQLRRAMHEPRSIPMEPGVSPPTEGGPLVVIRIAEDGMLTLEGEPIELADLARHDWPEEPRAIIATSGSVGHREVVTVIDALRATGVTRFALNVDPRSREEP